MNTKPANENILQFPQSKIIREVPKEQQQIREKRKTEKMAEAIVDEITDVLITELDNYFIDVENIQFRKDMVLVLDALRAAIYRQSGLDHHLHDFIDKNVRLIEGNFDGMSKEEIQAKIAELVKDLKDESEKLDNPQE